MGICSAEQAFGANSTFYQSETARMIRPFVLGWQNQILAFVRCAVPSDVPDESEGVEYSLKHSFAGKSTMKSVSPAERRSASSLLDLHLLRPLFLAHRRSHRIESRGRKLNICESSVTLVLFARSLLGNSCK